MFTLPSFPFIWLKKKKKKKYPPPFSGMLGFMSIFSFEFLALKCFSEGNSAYYDTVYMWCIGPILVISLIAISLLLFKVQARLSGHSFDHQVESMKNKHISAILLVSYMVLPPVLSQLLQVFDCIKISQHYYLRSDTAVSCESDEYLSFRNVVIVFFMMYQSIPLTLLLLLYNKRTSLNPPTSNHDPKLALFIRDNNQELASLRFLFKVYKCNKWWFEIADMYRRIVFIGIVPLVSANPSTRASFGCIFAIMGVAYFREEKPYRVEFTNTIAHIAQVRTTSLLSFFFFFFCFFFLQLSYIDLCFPANC
jgi:hypothetical protein